MQGFGSDKQVGVSNNARTKDGMKDGAQGGAHDARSGAERCGVGRMTGRIGAG